VDRGKWARYPLNRHELARKQLPEPYFSLLETLSDDFPSPNALGLFDFPLPSSPDPLISRFLMKKWGNSLNRHQIWGFWDPKAGLLPPPWKRDLNTTNYPAFGWNSLNRHQICPPRSLWTPDFTSDPYFSRQTPTFLARPLLFSPDPYFSRQTPTFLARPLLFRQTPTFQI